MQFALQPYSEEVDKAWNGPLSPLLDQSDSGIGPKGEPIILVSVAKGVPRECGEASSLARDCVRASPSSTDFLLFESYGTMDSLPPWS